MGAPPVSPSFLEVHERCNMTVEFINNPKDPDAIYWRKQKLVLDPAYVNKVASMMRNFKNDRTANKGWSKNRDLKWFGSIPAEVWYDKIQESDDQRYWQRDKYKNTKKWLNENPWFRSEDHIVR